MNSTYATTGGVGMLLSPRTLKSLNNVEKIHPRMIIATFDGNPTTTVISCYSPTNTSEEETVTEFYQQLSSLVRRIPKHNVVLIGGDINAQIGNEFLFHSHTNRNGQYLLDFATENELICLNTKFQKKQSKLWTHTYPTGAQLDFILINKK